MGWLYYSDVDHTVDINTGLVGGIVVTRRGSADAAGRPTDVDKEFFALFNVHAQTHAQTHAHAHNTHTPLHAGRGCGAM